MYPKKQNQHLPSTEVTVWWCGYCALITVFGRATHANIRQAMAWHLGIDHFRAPFTFAIDVE